jgi:DNA-binding transcriptional LysR family regulator
MPESDSDAMALRDGRIDVDIGALQDRGPEVLTAALYEQRIVGAVRQGHPLAGARLTLKRFVAAEHVAIAQRGQARESVDRALAAAGVERRVALTVPSAYGALMAAARSDMVACASEPLVRGVGAGLGLVMIKLPVDVPMEQVVQAWHPRVDADAAHQCLRRCIAALPSRPPSPLDPVLKARKRHEDLLALAEGGARRRQ